MVTVLMLVLAAFAVDFGRAYTTKRQLSTAADAAAIAAARYYATQQGTCAQFTADALIKGPLWQAASSIAKDYLDRNIASATALNLTVECAPGAKGVRVTFSDYKSTATTFGVLANVKQIPTSRNATADVYVPLSGNAVPFLLCFSDVQNIRDNPNTIQKASFPQPACDAYPGTWYTVNCPEDVNTSSQNNLDKFCKEPIWIIKTTPAGIETSDTETQLRTTCEDKPFSANPGCLQGNPGNIGNSGDRAFWDSLLGKTVLMPVIYKNTITNSSRGASGGSTLHVPIAGFLAAEVCGYHWGSNAHGQWTSDRCDSTHQPTPSLFSTDGGNTDYLLLTYSQYISDPGPVGGRADCVLGSTCDFGNRAVALIR
jgi:Flp pilus assembly protein TadG